MADEPVQFANPAPISNFPIIPCHIKNEKKSDRKSAGKGILEKIRSLYLPELETLLQECGWLRARLGMDGKNEVQESAKRLDQFASVIEAVIKEIHSFTLKKNADLAALSALEKKITGSILPVRSRLIGKLSRRNVDSQAGVDTRDPSVPVPAFSLPTTAPLGTHRLSSMSVGGNPSSRPQSPSPTSGQGLSVSLSLCGGQSQPQSLQSAVVGTLTPSDKEGEADEYLVKVKQEHVERSSSPSFSKPFLKPSRVSSANLSSVLTVAVSGTSIVSSGSDSDRSLSLSPKGRDNGVAVVAMVPFTVPSSSSRSAHLVPAVSSTDFTADYRPAPSIPLPVPASNDSLAPLPFLTFFSEDDSDFSGFSTIWGQDEDLQCSKTHHSDIKDAPTQLCDSTPSSSNHTYPESRPSHYYDVKIEIDGKYGEKRKFEGESVSPVDMSSSSAPSSSSSLQSQQQRAPVLTDVSMQHPGGQLQTGSSLSHSRGNALTQGQTQGSEVYTPLCPPCYSSGPSVTAHVRAAISGLPPASSIFTPLVSVLPPPVSGTHVRLSDTGSRPHPSALPTVGGDTVRAVAVLESDEEEGAGTGQDFISLRKRKKLNTIVPNPRKPRTADYMCANCAETYEVVVVDNPWWAIYSQECPTCKQTQIPRIDINAPSNAIELDPNVSALYGEGVADSGDECEEGSVGEEEDSKEEDDEETLAAASDRADREDHKRDVHPFDGEGLLGAEEASKLLVLMCHARSCVGIHASPTHANICKSTKYLMLHIRDCNGTDVHGRNCQFPWCLSCKKMLKHLTHCYEPASCVICAPRTLPRSFQELHKLNNSQQIGASVERESAPSAAKDDKQ